MNKELHILLVKIINEEYDINLQIPQKSSMLEQSEIELLISHNIKYIYYDNQDFTPALLVGLNNEQSIWLVGKDFEDYDKEDKDPLIKMLPSVNWEWLKEM